MRTRGQTASDEEEDSSGETTPLVRNPPPPPPPPPRGRTTPPVPPSNRQPPSPSPRQQQQQQRQHISTQQEPPNAPPQPPPPPPPPSLPPPPPAICSESWTLKIRHPGKGVLRIHVPKGMTAYLLSKCIIQATDIDDETIVGLFSYNDAMFVSLEHLLSCSETVPEDAPMLRKQIYSLHFPEALPSAATPWWQDWQVLLGGFVMLLAFLWLQQPLIFGMISAIPIALENLWNNLLYILPVMYHGLVTRPLQDTYRYGPSFMGGWEGASLTTICARMTYGDEEFWKRNLPDCESMYEAKESAFLFVGRPLVLLLLLLAFVWIVKQWLWYHELQQRERYQDRDMVQTYRAMQVLFRQVNRMAGSGDRARRPREDHHHHD